VASHAVPALPEAGGAQQREAHHGESEEVGQGAARHARRALRQGTSCHARGGCCDAASVQLCTGTSVHIGASGQAREEDAASACRDTNTLSYAHTVMERMTTGQALPCAAAFTVAWSTEAVSIAPPFLRRRVEFARAALFPAPPCRLIAVGRPVAWWRRARSSQWCGLPTLVRALLAMRRSRFTARRPAKT
jgi:hypothetical protein